MLILCVQSNKRLSCGATVEDLGAIIQYSTGKPKLKAYIQTICYIKFTQKKRYILFENIPLVNYTVFM